MQLFRVFLLLFFYVAEVHGIEFHARGNHFISMLIKRFVLLGRKYIVAVFCACLKASV